tara:strand:- start:93 stop:1055 length:963 start_codon:yes stop_codon:yes gene_type:complete
MKCLGIESTAHTWGCAVVDSKKNILTDIRDMYTTEEGGMIPIDVAKHHQRVKDEITEKAISNHKIDLVAYSRGPGLAPSLKVGKEKAIEIAKQLKVPLVGVNHPIGHLTSGLFWSEAKDPIFVFVSGANTQIISKEGDRFRIFGETLDVGLGNALDKFGRLTNIGFPAGPKIEEEAKQGDYIELPYVVKGMDLSFSGIVTSALTKYKKGIPLKDLCFSIQETTFAMLTEVTERALAYTNKKEVVIIGGVAANKRLSNMLNTMCKERSAKFYTVPLKYSGDNATFIAWQGILEKDNATKQYSKADIYPYERIDEIKINWPS